MSVMDQQLESFFGDGEYRTWRSKVTDSWIAHHVKPWDPTKPWSIAWMQWRWNRLQELTHVRFLIIEEEEEP